jgi:hypothetical protein
VKQTIRFEIIVTFQRKRFKAISPAFPTCQGTGETEQLAIEKLNQSIAKRIAEMAKSALTNMVNADPITVEPVERKNPNAGIRRVYQIDPGVFGGANKPARLAYPSDKTRYVVPPEQDIRRLFSQFQPDGFAPQSTLSDDTDDYDNEGMSFGFPLNLN